MHTLVLHTGADAPLVRGVASGFLNQRRALRRQGIGLRFAGISSPQRQWGRLARAMANQQQQAWLQALRWQRFRPRHTWLCAEGFHQPLLQEQMLNHWLDWFDSQQLRLVVVVHLLPPRQQSWQKFVRSTLLFKSAVQPHQDVDPALSYNDLYNALIETAGVRGSRFVLHTQSDAAQRQNPWPGVADQEHGDQDDMDGLLDRRYWPMQKSPTSQDLRPFVLSLAVTRLLNHPLQEKECDKLRRAVEAAATQLQPITIAEAQELATEAGWVPPDNSGLSANLERFALRVWGSMWPGEADGTGDDIPGTGEMGLQQLAAKQLALSTAARQLLERTSS